ncbi:MAG TPA: hypothetical protein GXX38_08460 [Clostridia bacterium]|nr:hypothetical protein [Clostridia bacterium]
MKIYFKSRKLKKQCEDPKEAQKEYGARIGNKLTQRVNELKSAPNLADIKKIPAARLHRLEGQRINEFAVDLVHPFRLVFKPILEGNANLDDLDSITVVRIEEVIDYHGKQKRK